MNKLIDGKAIAEQILKKTAQKVKELKKKKIIPRLGIVFVGNDRASEIYIKKKTEAAENIGISYNIFHFKKGLMSLPEMVKALKYLQKTRKLTGLIIQLPVPDKLYTSAVFNAVAPDIDVDCLTDINLGKLIMNTHTITPPTAGAVMEILKNLHINLVGKNVCLVGMGILVGKPLANILINARASVTTCNSKTKNIKQKCLDADIIISGVGKPNLIRGDMVKKGAIVIDTGISFVKNKVVGDVNVPEVLKKASYVTPTPGGVGPITVALLLHNTVLCAQKKIKK